MVEGRTLTGVCNQLSIQVIDKIAVSSGMMLTALMSRASSDTALIPSSAAEAHILLLTSESATSLK